MGSRVSLPSFTEFFGQRRAIVDYSSSSLVLPSPFLLSLSIKKQQKTKLFVKKKFYRRKGFPGFGPGFYRVFIESVHVGVGLFFFFLVWVWEEGAGPEGAWLGRCAGCAVYGAADRLSSRENKATRYGRGFFLGCFWEEALRIGLKGVSFFVVVVVAQIRTRTRRSRFRPNRCTRSASGSA